MINPHSDVQKSPEEDTFIILFTCPQSEYLTKD